MREEDWLRPRASSHRLGMANTVVSNTSQLSSKRVVINVVARHRREFHRKAIATRFAATARGNFTAGCCESVPDWDKGASGDVADGATGSRSAANGVASK